jgi:hypothetical protein
MKPHTRTMLQLLIRAAKGMITAVEEWLKAEPTA